MSEREFATIVGISGSLRAGSHHTALLRNMSDLMPPHMRMEIAEIADFPMYNFDIQVGGIPQVVCDLGEAIAGSAGVMISSPEYNGTIPAPLKNVIDWLSRLRPQPFQHKPIALISGSPGPLGGARAQYDLRKCLGLLSALVMPRPEVFVSRIDSVIDSQGALTDESLRKAISSQMAAFDAWIGNVSRGFVYSVDP